MHTYVIDRAHEAAHLYFSGHVTGRDIIATTKAFQADDGWVPGLNIIWNCRHVTMLDLQPEELSTVVALRTEDLTSREVSVVSRAVDAFIARLYQTLARAQGKEAYVCHTFSEAVEALGLDPAVEETLAIEEAV